ncbi:MAG: leucine-rich repeat domain-containing protein [Eubacterium sp.]|nr:leucine-rich repeat domain-containing protein [Eubacterium sp.]
MFKYYIDEKKQITITGYSGHETRLQIPANIDGYPVREVAESAFWGAAQLEEVIMPESIVTMSRRSFRECANLRRVEFSKNLTSLPANTFTECYMLRELKLPKRLLTCDHVAFEDSPIARIEFDKEVKEVDLELFRANASTIEEIVVEAGHNVYRVDDSALFQKTKEGEVLLFCYAQKYRKTSGYDKATYTVLDGTVAIAQEAFKNCYNLGNVIFPDSLKRIGAYAFKGSAVEEFVLPATVREIEIEALLSGSVFLARRRMLRSIKVSAENPVYEVNGAFLMRRGEHTYAAAVYFGDEMDVEIPQGTTDILDGAFMRSNIRQIVIGDSVQRIGERAFEGCKKLIRVKMQDVTWYVPKTTRGMDYIVSEIREEYLSCIKICADGRRFDERKYDALYSQLELVSDRILVAVNRLKSGCHLSNSMHREYLGYLKEHDWESVVVVADYDELEGLELLIKTEVVGEHNIDRLIERANREKKPAVQSYLMNYKNQAFGETLTDYEL